MVSLGKDPEFGINNFNTEKYKTESQTIVDSILTILFGIPGFFPSLPDLGMNIQSYFYQFWDELDTNVIKAQLQTQCEALSIFIRDGSLDVIKTTQSNGLPLLLILLPVLIGDTTDKLNIAIVQNDTGLIEYNYIYGNL